MATQLGHKPSLVSADKPKVTALKWVTVIRWHQVLIIEPQLQYSAMDVDLYNIGYNNADFQLQDGNSSLLRVGAAIRKSYKTAGGNYWTPYAAASYLDELEGNNSYLIGGLLEGDVDTSGGSALLEAGVTGFIGKFGVSGGVNWRDGGAYDSVFGGQVSLRYDW